MVIEQICNQDCYHTGQQCLGTSCEHWKEDRCSGPEEHPPGQPFNTSYWQHEGIWDVVRYNVSIPEEGILSYEGDWRVHRCHKCGNTFEHAAEVYAVQPGDGLGEYDIFWTCACGYDRNPMTQHVCDCGEKPCITQFSFGHGPEAGHDAVCPYAGVPTP